MTAGLDAHFRHNIEKKKVDGLRRVRWTNGIDKVILPPMKTDVMVR